MKELIHPIGLRLFGEYLFTDEHIVEVISPSSAANSTEKIVFSSNNRYTVSASNVRVTHNLHGMVANSRVYLDFTTGDTANVDDGYYLVRTVTQNTFNIVISKTATTTTGNVDVGLVI